MKRMFIIGCPRSGTTWTAMLLAQHPEIQACQQVGAVAALDVFHRYWEKGERRPHTRYISSVIRFGGATMAAAAPTYEPLMTRAEMIEISRSVLDQVYALAAAKRPGCRVIVDTTPENVRVPELIAELMPDARFLHLIRDPRSVFASHRNGTKDFGATFPTDPAGSASFWRKDVLRGRQLAALTPHYRELRYESLKQNGPAELCAILEWLGVTADPAWCADAIAKTSVEKLQGTSGTPTSFFRSGKAAGWRDELTPRQLHAVEFYARDLMIDLGYEPALASSTRKPAGMIVRDVAELVTTRARNATRWLRGRAST